MPFTVPEVGIRWAPTRKGLLEPTQRVDRYHPVKAEPEELKIQPQYDDMEEGELDPVEVKAAQAREEEQRRLKRPHIIERIVRNTQDVYPSLIFSGPPHEEEVLDWLGPAETTAGYEVGRAECEIGWALEKELAPLFEGLTGDPDHDLPYDAHLNSTNVWQWSADDWTVAAQPYREEYPWRPFCEGHPAVATSHSLAWAPLTPADAIHYPYKEWHGLTRSRVRPRAGILLAAQYRAVKDSVLSLLPRCTSLAKTYDELVPAWTRDFSVGVLDTVMDMQFHQLSWLRMQRKFRDLKGVENYLKTLLHAQLDPTPRCRISNFVGVRFDESWPSAVTSKWASQGVAVLDWEWDAGQDGAGKKVLKNHSADLLRKWNAINGIPDNVSVIDEDALTLRKLRARKRDGSKKRKAAAMEDIDQEDVRVDPSSARYMEPCRQILPVPSREGAFVVPNFTPHGSMLGLKSAERTLGTEMVVRPRPLDPRLAVPAVPTSSSVQASSSSSVQASSGTAPTAAPPPSAPLPALVQEASTTAISTNAEPSAAPPPKRKISWQERVAQKRAKAAESGAASS